MDMRFRTWHVRSLYREGSLKTVASEIARYNSDPVALQEVGSDKSGSKPEDNYTFVYGNGKANHNLWTSFLVYNGIISAVKRTELISNRMLYITIGGCWYDIIALNVHVHMLTEHESDGKLS
jgi:hypothetical protein